MTSISLFLEGPLIQHITFYRLVIVCLYQLLYNVKEKVAFLRIFLNRITFLDLHFPKSRKVPRKVLGSRQKMNWHHRCLLSVWNGLFYCFAHLYKQIIRSPSQAERKLN